MSVFDSLRNYLDDYRARRHRARTAQLLRGLPLEIQKDIGWRGSGLDACFDDPHGAARRSR